MENEWRGEVNPTGPWPRLPYQPRHWKKVFALLDGNFTGGLDLPIRFNQLLTDGAANFVEEIEEISGQAVGE